MAPRCILEECPRCTLEAPRCILEGCPGWLPGVHFRGVSGVRKKKKEGLRSPHYLRKRRHFGTGYCKTPPKASGYQGGSLKCLCIPSKPASTRLWPALTRSLLLSARPAHLQTCCSSTLSFTNHLHALLTLPCQPILRTFFVYLPQIK